MTKTYIDKIFHAQWINEGQTYFLFTKYEIFNFNSPKFYNIIVGKIYDLYGNCIIQSSWNYKNARKKDKMNIWLLRLIGCLIKSSRINVTGL